MPARKQVLLRWPRYDARLDDRMLYTHSTYAGRDTMPDRKQQLLRWARYDARVDDRMLCTHSTPTLSATRSPRRLSPIVNETMLCRHSTFYAQGARPFCNTSLKPVVM